MESPVRHREGGMLDELTRWRDAGLVSAEQVGAIVEFEQERTPERKIPLIAEALGYIGAVLALAGGGVALGQVWDDLSEPAHAGIFTAGAIAALVAGISLRDRAEPAMQRMLSVLWALSVGAVVAAASVLFVDIAELPEDASGVTIGGTGCIYAAALWRFHKRTLQEAAVFATGLGTVLGIVVLLPGEPMGWDIALTMWAYGIAWLLLGWYRVVEPTWGAIAMGALVVSFAPSIDAADDGWLLGVGLLSGASLMALSIAGRELPLLVIGGIASFGYLTAIVVRYFGDALGIPLSLAIVGVLVLGAALLVGRSYGTWHRTHGEPA